MQTTVIVRAVNLCYNVCLTNLGIGMPSKIRERLELKKFHKAHGNGSHCIDSSREAFLKDQQEERARAIEERRLYQELVRSSNSRASHIDSAGPGGTPTTSHELRASTGTGGTSPGRGI